MQIAWVETAVPNLISMKLDRLKRYGKLFCKKTMKNESSNHNDMPTWFILRRLISNPSACPSWVSIWQDRGSFSTAWFVDQDYQRELKRYIWYVQPSPCSQNVGWFPGPMFSFDKWRPEPAQEMNDHALQITNHNCTLSPIGTVANTTLLTAFPFAPQYPSMARSYFCCCTP